MESTVAFRPIFPIRETGLYDYSFTYPEMCRVELHLLYSISFSDETGLYKSSSGPKILSVQLHFTTCLLLVRQVFTIVLVAPRYLVCSKRWYISHLLWIIKCFLKER